MRMIGDNLLVKMEEPERITKGGIHLIYDKPTTEERYGKVVKVSDRVQGISEGDRIMIEADRGVPVELEGEAFRILNRADVVCVVKS